MINLSKNQTMKLALHTMNISTILLEACLTPEEQEADAPEPMQDDGEIEIDIFEQAPWEEQVASKPLLDAFCGKWAGKNKKQPYLHILKTVDGYMVVFGKQDKRKNSYPDLFHLFSEKEYAYFDVENERIYISRNADNDTLILSPGGTYTRETNPQK